MSKTLSDGSASNGPISTSFYRVNVSIIISLSINLSLIFKIFDTSHWTYQTVIPFADLTFCRDENPTPPASTRLAPAKLDKSVECTIKLQW